MHWFLCIKYMIGVSIWYKKKWAIGAEQCLPSWLSTWAWAWQKRNPLRVSNTFFFLAFLAKLQPELCRKGIYLKLIGNLHYNLVSILFFVELFPSRGETQFPGWGCQSTVQDAYFLFLLAILAKLEPELCRRGIHFHPPRRHLLHITPFPARWATMKTRYAFTLEM